ncbi:uncharacterized protein LOC108164877 isoform X2 [Drosophila miranda]|uniref:uncharacterized protein LOC108164877 isoform X1 n=2 Tax=Drosophila miranda TaxID=7229 RepID=UPI0007E8938C|nr:uncharacterized protein LOC108164877 isoform X1 [Drosophila miranda]XP_017156313.1 uncharacterized protein LOC108164877 isoform X1 [Drosophila miranda]XP_017156314.1 uncharacterized protein LOC108164877 isoform X2 [Drosophila miranda]
MAPTIIEFKLATIGGALKATGLLFAKKIAVLSDFIPPKEVLLTVGVTTTVAFIFFGLTRMNGIKRGRGRRGQGRGVAVDVSRPDETGNEQVDKSDEAAAPGMEPSDDGQLEYDVQASGDGIMHQNVAAAIMFYPHGARPNIRNMHNIFDHYNNQGVRHLSITSFPR